MPSCLPRRPIRGCWLLDVFLFFVVLPLCLRPLLRPFEGAVVLVVGGSDLSLLVGERRGGVRLEGGSYLALLVGERRGGVLVVGGSDLSLLVGGKKRWGTGGGRK